MQSSSILSTGMVISSLLIVASAKNPFKVTVPSILYCVDVATPEKVQDHGIRGKHMLFTSDLMVARTAASKVKSSPTGTHGLSAYVYYIKTAGIQHLFAYTRDGGSSEIKEFQTGQGIPFSQIKTGEAIATDGQVISSWEFTKPEFRY
ncbi:hypothetical protein PspLS_03312 [Pyricularia sp. CBS 133598]|nr:hypothetical protein PspLS_03312 [Pyricularia sp. CBS 133598]